MSVTTLHVPTELLRYCIQYISMSFPPTWADAMTDPLSVFSPPYQTPSALCHVDVIDLDFVIPVTRSLML